MYDVILLLPKEQFNKLLGLLPTERQKKEGRRRCNKKYLINGILQHLVNGVAWRKIANCRVSYSSCYRYFREIQRRGKLKLIYKALVREKTDVTEAAIDTNSASSFRFRRMTGWDGKHKKIATKISLLTDKEGLPTDVSFGKGSIHDLVFVPGHIQNGGYRRRIKVLNLDKGYTSCDLRRSLRKRGTYVNMQTKRGDYIRKRGPKFRFSEDKYKVRFKVERTHAWMEGFRALRLRREYLPAMFKASVYLTLIIILLRV